MEQTEVERIAMGQLDSGERLLWSGSPTASGAALGALPAAVFGIVFTAFASFWIWTAAGATSRSAQGDFTWTFFPLFGVPFLLIGIGLMLSPLWAFLGARKTVYALTDRRALIVMGPPLRGVRSFTPQDIGEIVRVERADGWGTLSFASISPTTPRGFERRSRVSFVGIPEVRRVEQLLRENLLKSAA